VLNCFFLSLVGMCLGEKKTLVLPPDLAYASKGAGADIPPHATLRFVVDLVGVNDNSVNLTPTADPNIFSEMDSNRDLMISYNEMENWFRTMHPDKLDRIPAGLFEREDKNGVSVRTAGVTAFLSCIYCASICLQYLSDCIRLKQALPVCFALFFNASN
jgi:hypothetical protein